MITLTEENYLKAIYHLAEKNGEVSVTDLSRFLGIKMPSVNSMIKKFNDKNWVNYEIYKPLTLTEEGKRKAAIVVRKHRLTEMYLVEKMGFGWEEVHQIAEEIEHIRSEAFFDKIDQLLDYPKIDPHGSPIPDKSGKVIKLNYFKLSECKAGEKVKFSALYESEDKFLNFLNQKRLTLGTTIAIKSIEEFDQNMHVQYLDRNEVFSKIVAEKLLVEKL